MANIKMMQRRKRRAVAVVVEILTLADRNKGGFEGRGEAGISWHPRPRGKLTERHVSDPR